MQQNTERVNSVINWLLLCTSRNFSKPQRGLGSPNVICSKCPNRVLLLWGALGNQERPPGALFAWSPLKEPGRHWVQLILLNQRCQTKASPNMKWVGCGSEERNGRQVTSIIALRSQVHNWVQGQVHAFEYKPEKKSNWLCGCVGLEGRGAKSRRKKRLSKKIIFQGKIPHLLQHSR